MPLSFLYQSTEGGDEITWQVQKKEHNAII